VFALDGSAGVLRGCCGRRSDEHTVTVTFRPTDATAYGDVFAVGAVGGRSVYVRVRGEGVHDETAL
jgi:hypothetical protein